MEPSPSPSYCFSQSSHVFFKIKTNSNSCYGIYFKVGMESGATSTNFRRFVCIYYPVPKRDKMDQFHKVLIWCLLIWKGKFYYVISMLVLSSYSTLWHKLISKRLFNMLILQNDHPMDVNVLTLCAKWYGCLLQNEDFSNLIFVS